MANSTNATGLNTTAPTCQAKICEAGGGGLLLPAFETELVSDETLRVLLYCVALLWSFLGVAIATDYFMAAIQKITSKRVRLWNRKTMEFTSVKVWSESLANLSLMAIGASAPEILLCVIELVSGGMLAGELGLWTIVGSAGFNLFLVSAVCVAKVGSNEVRKIKALGVFGVTAVFCIAAYVWLYIIVEYRTPDVIDIEEGAGTLGGFPVLLLLAFFADCSCCRKKKTLADSQKAPLETATLQDLAVMETQILRQYGPKLKDGQIVELMEREYGDKISRAHYRIDAVRRLVSGRRIPCLHDFQMNQAKLASSSKVVELPSAMVEDSIEAETERTFFEFLSSKYSVVESARSLELAVVRRGAATENPVQVTYRTRDGTAVSPKDYVHAEGTLEFARVGQTQTFTLEITQDDVIEDLDTFFVDLLQPVGSDSTVRVELGEAKTARVNIIDDDSPGVLSFDAEDVMVREGPTEQNVSLWVKRTQGSQGVVSCKYKTENGSASAPQDFDEARGTVEFGEGQLEVRLDVVVKPNRRVDERRQFSVQLYDPEGGASFAESWEGCPEPTACAVVIESDAVANDRLTRVMQALRRNLERMQFGFKDWKEQFAAAILVNGGDDEAETPPSFGEYAVHVFVLFWKVLFAAVIPPVTLWGGWPCFGVSLLMIGVVTAAIGDLAALIGCFVGMPDAVTAITFIALGASLPDAVAAPASAKQDSHADVAITSITGSVAVNVFLGLGLPWFIGAVYWDNKGWTQEWEDWVRIEKPDVLDVYPTGGKFVVAGGNFGFSAVIFMCCALATLLLLVVRRKTLSVGGELGGPRAIARATSGFLVLLWLIFVLLSVWHILSNPRPCDQPVSLPFTLSVDLRGA